MLSVISSSATLVGFLAVLMWSLLAVLTAGTGDVPPFQLTAMSLFVGGIVGLVYREVSGHKSPVSALQWQVWLLGIGGIFGYHFLFFSALRNAPVVEAGLINYLWPVLIILFSSFLPGENLRSHHLLGGFLGFAGAWLIVSKGGAVTFQAEYAFGYVVAVLAALTWSSYSVLSRSFSSVPSDVITWFCLVGAVLSLLCHLILEKTLWPQNTGEWLCVLGLGLGPVGAAFYVWDYGVKHGDIQVLGASSYLAPLLSTLILVLVGYAEPTWVIALAGLLISGGAAFASKDVILRKRRVSG